MARPNILVAAPAEKIGAINASLAANKGGRARGRAMSWDQLNFGSWSEFPEFQAVVALPYDAAKVSTTSGLAWISPDVVAAWREHAAASHVHVYLYPSSRFTLDRPGPTILADRNITLEQWRGSADLRARVVGEAAQSLLTSLLRFQHVAIELVRLPQRRLEIRARPYIRRVLDLWCRKHKIQYTITTQSSLAVDPLVVYPDLEEQRRIIGLKRGNGLSIVLPFDAENLDSQEDLERIAVLAEHLLASDLHPSSSQFAAVDLLLDWPEIELERPEFGKHGLRDMVGRLRRVQDAARFLTTVDSAEVLRQHAEALDRAISHMTSTLDIIEGWDLAAARSSRTAVRRQFDEGAAAVHSAVASIKTALTPNEDAPASARPSKSRRRIPGRKRTARAARHPRSRTGRAPAQQRLGAWMTIGDKIGEGGQGEVYRAYHRKRLEELVRSIRPLASARADAVQSAAALLALVGALGMPAVDNAPLIGALKVLHKKPWHGTPNQARRRMANEIRAMQEFQDPHFVRMLESAPDGRWYVMEWLPGKGLDRRLDEFTGEPLKALRTIRPLVESLARFHRAEKVHRDIKPENILAAGDGTLKIGDLGLVWFLDEDKKRLSKTLEQCGTAAWMAPWTSTVRPENIRPTADVFPLAKMLYAMVSKLKKLRNADHRDPEFALERMFPDKPEVGAIQRILDRTVVPRESECLPDAGALLTEVDEAIFDLEHQGLRPLVTQLETLAAHPNRVDVLVGHVALGAWTGRAAPEHRRAGEVGAVLAFEAVPDAQYVDLELPSAVPLEGVTGLLATIRVLEPREEFWLCLRLAEVVGGQALTRWLAYGPDSSKDGPDPKVWSDDALQWWIGWGPFAAMGRFDAVRRDLHADLANTVLRHSKHRPDRILGFRVYGHCLIHRLTLLRLGGLDAGPVPAAAPATSPAPARRRVNPALRPVLVPVGSFSGDGWSVTLENRGTEQFTVVEATASWAPRDGEAVSIPVRAREGLSHSLLWGGETQTLQHGGFKTVNSTRAINQLESLGVRPADPAKMAVTFRFTCEAPDGETELVTLKRPP